MKVAVTGANGHLGANVVRALLAAGHSVIAIVRSSSDCRSIEDLDLDFRVAEVTRANELEMAFDGASHVINLAAVVSIDGDQGGLVTETNVHGPGAVATACLRTDVKRLVHVSSIHAFLSEPELPKLDEEAERPGMGAFAYDRSKFEGEQAVRDRIGHGLDAVILNPTGIIGPHDYGSSYTGKMLRQLFKGRLPVLVKGGFDWVDARDVAAACVAALTHGRSGENYILSGTFAMVDTLARACSELSGARPPFVTLPVWAAVMGLPFLIPWTRITGVPPLYTMESLTTLKYAHPNISSDKARDELGYSARPLSETLTDCYAWYGRG